MVPLNARHSPAELAYALQDSGAGVLFARGETHGLPASVEHLLDFGDRNEAPLGLVVGERAARQSLFFDRRFQADSAVGRLIADEVVPADQIEAAIAARAGMLCSAGRTSLIADRMALRCAQEPVRRVPGVHGRVRLRAGSMHLCAVDDRRAGAQLGDVGGGGRRERAILTDQSIDL
ncbi:MAG: hypothetical protein ACRDMX_16625 [Solirubrobacteraceae bacterium]